MLVLITRPLGQRSAGVGRSPEKGYLHKTVLVGTVLCKVVLVNTVLEARRTQRPTQVRTANMRASPLEYFLRIVDRSWRVLGPLMHGHAVVYRATGGRLGGWLPGVPPMLLLDHIGAKSGKPRTTPLVYMPDGDRFFIVAAKGGAPQNPAWLYNLRAHPDTRIQIGKRRIDVHAREADTDERQTLWPKALAYTAHWRRYARRSQRTIPLLILEPR
jgi:F420H(2)-dependent quinone reductase